MLSSRSDSRLRLESGSPRSPTLSPSFGVPDASLARHPSLVTRHLSPSSRSVQKEVWDKLLVTWRDCVLIEISDTGFP